MEQIDETIQAGHRILITTLTKRMAEELTDFLLQAEIKTQYIHSEVKTLQRVEILRQLRLGLIDVLVGVNLLREGLDLPEVSLVAILDADKEGFLRNQRSLIQTIGRAARNLSGRVLMYADKMTDSMLTAINETSRRRKIQLEYNELNNITPFSINKSREEIMDQTKVADVSPLGKKYYIEEEVTLAAEPVTSYADSDQLELMAEKTRKEMEAAAKELDFIRAAGLRDELQALEILLSAKKPA